MREKDDTQDQTHESQSEIVCGGQQLFEHEHLRAEMERLDDSYTGWSPVLLG